MEFMYGKKLGALKEKAATQQEQLEQLTAVADELQTQALQNEADKLRPMVSLGYHVNVMMSGYTPMITVAQADKLTQVKSVLQKYKLLQHNVRTPQDNQFIIDFGLHGTCDRYPEQLPCHVDCCRCENRHFCHADLKKVYDGIRMVSMMFEKNR